MQDYVSNLEGVITSWMGVNIMLINIQRGLAKPALPQIYFLMQELKSLLMLIPKPLTAAPHAQVANAADNPQTAFCGCYCSHHTVADTEYSTRGSHQINKHQHQPKKLFQSLQLNICTWLKQPNFRKQNIQIFRNQFLEVHKIFGVQVVGEFNHSKVLAQTLVQKPVRCFSFFCF
ncbi:hypothetical protein OXYTRIMIC_375 [Oxytricha trifallax]|uniref:Uncharacterized protein n=1 Tax=Oxytricha trifallax TaxID=1172189 RepID=A0A073HY96_9SPIT|nr:hypothetical protein OXYTRIMIC_375 [Oxytricha trifallax]